MPVRRVLTAAALLMIVMAAVAWAVVRHQMSITLPKVNVASAGFDGCSGIPQQTLEKAPVSLGVACADARS
jgi:hypothetical protein